MSEHSGLLTDLYELTMAAGYLQTRFEARATFELFVRHLPPHRNYLVAAGLEQALDFLENVHFTAKEIDYLRQHPVFRNIRGEFFDYLAKFRFTGDVWAMPEGSLVFPGEPMLRIVAPIIEGQIMETYFLSTLSYQTMIASKAARVVSAAKGRQVVDFGARRARRCDRRMPGHVQRPSRPAIRHGNVRHTSALLGDGARRRDRSIRAISRRVSRTSRAAA